MIIPHHMSLITPLKRLTMLMGVMIPKHQPRPLTNKSLSQGLHIISAQMKTKISKKIKFIFLSNPCIYRIYHPLPHFLNIRKRPAAEIQNILMPKMIISGEVDHRFSNISYKSLVSEVLYTLGVFYIS